MIDADIYISWKCCDIKEEEFKLMCSMAYDRLMAKASGAYEVSDVIRRVMSVKCGDDKNGMYITYERHGSI